MSAESHLLCNDHFARLQILDHAQQLRAIGARTRSLLSIDAGDVEAGGLGLLDDRGLSREVLAISADALVNPSNLERFCRSARHQMPLASSAGVGITSDMVASYVAFLGIPKRTIKFTGGPKIFMDLNGPPEMGQPKWTIHGAIKKRAGLQRRGGRLPVVGGSVVLGPEAPRLRVRRSP